MTNKKTDYNKLLSDPLFRSNIRSNPAKYVELLNNDTTGKEGIEYVVKTNTKKVLYIAILDAAYLKDEDMLTLQAAGKKINISTVSSAGSGGSISSATTTISSVSSAGTAGSAGSVDV